jgi:hypothetical protein
LPSFIVRQIRSRGKPGTAQNGRFPLAAAGSLITLE